MTIKVPRLYKNRYGVFFFRYLVPANLVPVFGQNEFRQSLRTKNPVAAKMLALTLNAGIESMSKHDDDVSKIESDIPSQQKILERISARLPSSQKKEYEPNLEDKVIGEFDSVLIREEAYQQEKKKRLALQKNLEYNPPEFQSLVPHHKYEIDVARGTLKAEGEEDHKRMMEALTHYRAIFKEMPSMTLGLCGANAIEEKVEQEIERANNPPLYFKKLTAQYLQLKAKNKSNSEGTISEKIQVYTEFEKYLGDLRVDAINKRMIVAFKDSQLNDDISPRQVKKKISFLSDFFQWAIDDEKLPEPNPCRGVKVISKGEIEATSEKWLPFSTQEIKTIFNPITYEKRMNNPYYYWIPLIGLYTGARIESIATIATATVKTAIYDVKTKGKDGEEKIEKKEISHFFLNDTKNRQSQRHIPIHPKLIELGFLDYVQKMRDEKKELLFGEYKIGKNGLSKNMIRRWAQYLGELGIRTTEGKNLKVFHSLRKTLIQILEEELKEPPQYVYQLTGHKYLGAGLDDTHNKHYVNRFTITSLYQVIEKVVFPITLKRKYF